MDVRDLSSLERLYGLKRTSPQAPSRTNDRALSVASKELTYRAASGRSNITNQNSFLSAAVCVERR